MHLPTARELAKIIKSRGGIGLLNDRKAEQRESSDFGRVRAKNYDGKEDDFYYSNERYVAPAGDIGDVSKYELLSSSVDAERFCVLGLRKDWRGKGYITCTGVEDPAGHTYDEYRDNHGAFLCIVGGK
jgi:hypothetical protein